MSDSHIGMMKWFVTFQLLSVAKAGARPKVNVSLPATWDICNSDDGMQGASGCGRCVEMSVILDRVCHYCLIDNQCHTVGSGDSPCSGSSDQCISLSTVSNCDKKSKDQCPPYKVGPGGVWDYNPWNDNCFMTDYQAACGVDANSDRNYLPTVDEDATFEITFRRNVFGLLTQPPMDSHSAYHSGILVQQHGSINAFHIELVALRFDQSIAVPDIDPLSTQVTWHNDAALEWMPALSRGWDDVWDSWIRMGSASGKTVNRWLAKALGFIAARPKYVFLGVWSDPDVTKADIYLEDSICHSFSEWSLQVLHDEGADFSAVTQPVCRNYMTYITEQPQAIDMSNFKVAYGLKLFYVKVLACFAALALDEANWLPVCYGALEQEGKIYYVDQSLETYYTAVTKGVAFNRFGSEDFTEQRMRLPWQDWKHEATVGECAFAVAQTSVTTDLNSRIQRHTDMAYTFGGGGGVLLRPLMDNHEGGDTTVVPSHFWHNDIHAPSMLRPQSGGGYGSPFCPNDGSDGFGDMPSCDADEFGETGPWNYAQLAAVVGSGMSNVIPSYDWIQNDDWGDWVFYPFQADSVDSRCKRGKDGYDCPGAWLPDTGKVQWQDASKGAGGYGPGNDQGQAGGGGGGAGCHWESYGPGIDQTDGVADDGNSLVQDYDCQCNYAFKKDDWWSWVDAWLQHAAPKPGFEFQGWFGSGLAPSWGMSVASCWVNNPRDMINIQNTLYWRRLEWNNQRVPKTNWDTSDTPKDVESLRQYWGWNEVPVGRDTMNDPMNWDAIVIKLPAAACNSIGTNDDSAYCLGNGQQIQLERDLDAYVNSGYIVPGLDNIGYRPGSYVVFAREFMDINGQFQREFFCESWTSPNARYQVVFDRISKWASRSGACYLEYGSGRLAV